MKEEVKGERGVLTIGNRANCRSKGKREFQLKSRVVGGKKGLAQTGTSSSQGKHVREQSSEKKERFRERR